ncbi:hypothetical protein OOT46_24125 [Aquabacterium sp. A7-Y]|uniref:hypothetical protein n=1 Tax=Aquabacterium sp. A7-Y TaxID=1349605 RepID=UPI00223D1E36|nr:hypothetical protein [Aquabacterium sp. A7-Y]MCW7540913.1 hypothetical protein [Aquabacterium sp. A7-Y]
MSSLAVFLGACGGGGDDMNGGGARGPSSAMPGGTLERVAIVRPGPSNTGVPAGTQLVPSGPLRITTPDQVIDRLDVAGCVNVMAPRVKIRRTRIRCGSYYPVRVFDGASLTIEDSEIDGSSAAGKATSGIAFGNYVARRVNIHGTADGVKAQGNVLLELSWIHDLYLAPGDHADGVQSTGNSTNVTVRNNFIDILDHGRGHGGNPNSCFQVGTEQGGNSNWTISGNWLYGGGWVINVNSGPGTNDRIINNRFGRGVLPSGQRYPVHGPMVLYGDWTKSGNVWDDTGTPVAIAPAQP